MKNTLRIVFSLLLISCACAAPSEVSDDDPNTADGIGTSPSEPASKPLECPPDPCGLWLTEARHAARPDAPDAVQYARPGGLSCAWLLASAPAGAVVYYVAP